jgi:hypothetical protein
MDWSGEGWISAAQSREHQRRDFEKECTVSSLLETYNVVG